MPARLILLVTYYPLECLFWGTIKEQSLMKGENVAVWLYVGANDINRSILRRSLRNVASKIPTDLAEL